MSFTNVYYKRTAATAKACYVCYRPTTTVLATVNTVDFIYACPGHLTDHNFATRIVDESGPVKRSVSPEEIAKIKQEWEEKEKKKQEKEKEEEKAKEDDKKDKKKDEAGSKEGSKSPKPPGALSPASGPSTPAAPKHERYSLHRDFYAMRQLEHKKRRQVAQAKELAPRLPGAPTASVASSKEDKY
ncbi:VPS4-associated protein 1 [Ephemerocybe angulata]|uniref:VPS4-associated protein 1 n=1 Tax=Ephemerocybe angulata TaxID=980116 RepID=A0A8H6IC34_9AGAR|nr:VPS4-associated protein 1 [Tulosesus angulatus]